MYEDDYPRPFGLTTGEMALELAEEHYYSMSIAELLTMPVQGKTLSEALDSAYARIVADYQNLDSDRIIHLYRGLRARYNEYSIPTDMENDQ